MMSISEDFRRLAVCYQGLVERAAQPLFKQRFAYLAAAYAAVAAWREGVERAAVSDDPQTSGLQ